MLPRRSPELRNKVLKPLQDLKAQLADAVAPPALVQPPAPAAKPIKVVRVADMGSKTYLESEANRYPHDTCKLCQTA